MHPRDVHYSKRREGEKHMMRHFGRIVAVEMEVAANAGDLLIQKKNQAVKTDIMTAKYYR